jgi:hypothetical protein
LGNLNRLRYKGAELYLPLFGLDFKNSIKDLLIASGFLALNRVLAKVVEFLQRTTKKTDEQELLKEYEKARQKKAAIDKIITSPAASALNLSRNQSLRIIRALIVRDLDESSVQDNTPPPEEFIDLTPTFNLYVQDNRLFLLENKQNLIGYIEPPMDKRHHVIVVFFTVADKPHSIERKVYKLDSKIRIP